MDGAQADVVAEPFGLYSPCEATIVPPNLAKVTVHLPHHRLPSVAHLLRHGEQAFLRPHQYSGNAKPDQNPPVRPGAGPMLVLAL
jgi:hypothetical protein